MEHLSVDGIIGNVDVDDREDFELCSERGEDDGRLLVDVALERDLRVEEHAEVARVAIVVGRETVGSLIRVDLEGVSEGSSAGFRLSRRPKVAADEVVEEAVRVLRVGERGRGLGTARAHRLAT